MARRNRRKLWLVVVGVAVALVSPRMPAAAVEDAMPVPAAQPVRPLEAAGTVSLVDVQRHVLTLERTAQAAEAGAPNQIAFSEQTRVSRDGIALSLSDLAPSPDPAVIQYQLDAGVPTATSVAYGPPGGLLRLEGTIAAIDIPKRTVAIESRGLFGSGQQSFALDESTLVVRRGQRSYLAHLIKGDRVTVEYAPTGGVPVARTMTLAAPAVEPPRAKAEEEPARKGWFFGLGRPRTPEPQPSGASGTAR